MWALDLYVYHICRINFEYIFREYSPNLLHFQQQFYFASLFTFCLMLILFVWYWISFVSVPSSLFIVSSRKSCRWTTFVLFFQSSLVCSFSLYFRYPAYPFFFFFFFSVFASSMVHVETLRFHLRSSLLRGSVYRLLPGRSADKSQSNHGGPCSRHLHFGFLLVLGCLFIAASFLSFTDVYLSFSSSLQQFFLFWPSFLPTLVRFIQCLRRFYDTQ